jgi:hypothetical protein
MFKLMFERFAQFDVGALCSKPMFERFAQFDVGALCSYRCSSALLNLMLERFAQK